MRSQHLTNDELLDEIDKLTAQLRELIDAANNPAMPAVVSLAALEEAAEMRRSLQELHTDHCLRIGLGRMKRQEG